MSADDLDPPKLAGHGMPWLEIENLAQALLKAQEFFT